MKLGDLFKSLATKAGIDINALATKDANFASILGVAVEVPDDVASQVETNLFTLDSAKSNNAIKSHFFAQALDGVDGTLEKIAKKRQISDDDWNLLKGEKNTMKRIEMLEEKLLSVRDAKDNATSKTEKGQLQKQIDDLQKELRETKEGHTAALGNQQIEFTKRETSLMIDALLAQRNFANKDVPLNVNILTAKALIDQSLAKDGVKVVNKDGVIRILKQDESDYYDSKHNKVDAGTYFDGVLGGNKMLTVTDSSAGDKKNQSTTVVDGDKTKVNTAMLGGNQDALNSLSLNGYQ
jgi:hypothetical protein